ncbi:MAG: AraC family transcriptional regulator [Mycolicibacterium neoaurum]|uniref:AraC family transcriptional regulator n=1 Tax=Mycolicibacterium neoaurum TaxID=1795 RepID=UPI002FF6AF14
MTAEGMTSESNTAASLSELGRLVDTHAVASMTTTIDGLLFSRVDTSEPEYSLTEPLLVVMVQGAKRILLGDQMIDYRSGDILVVAADLPVSGHFVGADADTPALGVGMVLRPAAIAELLLADRGRLHRADVSGPAGPAMASGPAEPALLDAVLRLSRMVEHPEDAAVLGPLVEKEILWRLLTGPHGALVARIGTTGGVAAHINGTIRWIRDNYAEPLRIADLAALAGMSPSSFHRHFRAVASMSPLQFQKRIRLQQARAMLAADAGDVAGVGHLVGYDSPTQFSREYRRMFGAPPRRDMARGSAPAPLLP